MLRLRTHHTLLTRNQHSTAPAEVWLLDTCSTPTADPRQQHGAPETEGARGKGVVSAGAIRFPGIITAQGGQSARAAERDREVGVGQTEQTRR